MKISTTIWRVKHPNTGQNIQYSPLEKFLWTPTTLTFSVAPSIAKVAVGSKQLSDPGRQKVAVPPSLKRRKISTKLAIIISVWALSLGFNTWILKLLFWIITVTLLFHFDSEAVSCSSNMDCQAGVGFGCGMTGKRLFKYLPRLTPFTGGGGGCIKFIVSNNHLVL